VFIPIVLAPLVDLRQSVGGGLRLSERIAVSALFLKKNTRYDPEEIVLTLLLGYIGPRVTRCAVFSSSF
jgi:hypothetical protein